MTPSRYSTGAILLHWLLAGLLAFQIGTGWLMEEMDKGTGLFNLAQFHKSVGISILLLTVLRIAIRITQPRPTPLTDDPIAGRLAQAVHAGLYIFMLAVPLSGWVLVSTSSRNIETILFNTIPWPHIPGFSGASEAVQAGIHDAAVWLHGSLTWFGIGLFLLHVVGALRHQYAKGEPLLGRILPVRGADRKTSGSAIIAALGVAVAGLLLVGQNFHMAPSAAVPSALDPNAAPSKTEGVADKSTLSRETSEVQTPSPDEANEANSEAEALDALEESDFDLTAVGTGIPAGTAPNWTLSENRTLRFVTKWGNDEIRGSFSRWSGTVRFNPDALDKSSVRIVVDLTSANTSDAERDQMLQEGDFFATSSAANATYTATSFRKISGGRYQANGMLTLKGISKPQALTFTLDIDGKKAVVSGNSALSRSAYNVGVGDYGEIADMVQLQFNFSATR